MEPEAETEPPAPGGCCPVMSPGCGEERVAWLPAGDSPACPQPCRDGAVVHVEPGEHPEPLTEDDVYCRCLSQALCHTATPVTVGVYAPCGHRLYALLDKVTGFMKEEMARREEAELRRSHQRPRSPEGWGLLLALWYLAFYKPVLTELHLRRRNVEFIFIRFSAWQYAGCDKLWAGLVTTLCASVRRHFGALPLSVYHVVGTRPGYASGFSQREWVLKRGACLKLWGLLVLLGAGLAVLLAALLVPGVAESHALKVAGGAAASLSGSGLLLGAASVLKNLLLSEKRKIERLTNSDKFPSQLGFMSKVRAEVEALVGFLAFMEIFERRQLRVVLEITSLDACYPEKVAGVLNAMNTLLSDAHSPFIFLLAVDPGVLVPCLEQASCLRGLADNGYVYLNRTVTLPFSIPAMGARSKLRCLQEAVETREDLMYRVIARNVERSRRRLLAAAAAKGAAPAPEPGGLEAAAVAYVHAALRALHDEADPLWRYVPCSRVQLRRIVNTIPVTLRLLLHRAAEGEPPPPPPRAAAAWVVLANQWPCRLSWALQCLGDAGGPRGGCSLWAVFAEHRAELAAARDALRNALGLDGAPELFERFLARDFPFSGAEAARMLPFTVNLDPSIGHRMGLLRAMRRLAAPDAAPAPAVDPGPTAVP